MKRRKKTRRNRTHNTLLNHPHFVPNNTHFPLIQFAYHLQIRLLPTSSTSPHRNFYGPCIVAVVTQTTTDRLTRTTCIRVPIEQFFQFFQNTHLPSSLSSPHQKFYCPCPVAVVTQSTTNTPPRVSI
jgi:hypothetical protein